MSAPVCRPTPRFNTSRISRGVFLTLAAMTWSAIAQQLPTPLPENNKTETRTDRAALGNNHRADDEGLNARGLESNQRLLRVGGARAPQIFNFGAFAAGQGDSTA